MGFDAIYISPVVKNTPGGYHGYWASEWDQINQHFGTEEDLKDLVKEAHALDMYVMVDVVANHVGYVSNNDFSSIKPFNDKSHYHKDCEINDWYDRWQLENCRLCGLPDLAQEHPFVRNYLK